MRFNDRLTLITLAYFLDFEYDSRMNSRRIAQLLACFWLILVASTASAGSLHPHAHHAGVIDGAPIHPHAPKAVSPFETKVEKKLLHCELLGHNPLLPCPHHQIPARGKDNCYLSNDCGGGPSQVPSSRSVGDSPRFLVSVTSAEDDLQIAVGSINPTVLYNPFYSSSPYRPPRTL